MRGYPAGTICVITFIDEHTPPGLLSTLVRCHPDMHFGCRNCVKVKRPLPYQLVESIDSPPICPPGFWPVSWMVPFDDGIKSEDKAIAVIYRALPRVTTRTKTQESVTDE